MTDEKQAYPPTVLQDLRAAIGLTDNTETHVRIEAFDKNGIAILIVLQPEFLIDYQTPGQPWRFKCTIVSGFGETKHQGSFFLQDGEIYIDVPGYDMYAYKQVVKVQNSLVPLLSGNSKIEALIKRKHPDIKPAELSAQVAAINISDALDAKFHNGTRAQFYLEKTSGRMDAQVTLTPIAVQIPGRPWVFAVDVQTGWFRIKSGTVYCENGMLIFDIDGRPRFVIPQKKRVEDVMVPDYEIQGSTRTDQDIIDYELLIQLTIKAAEGRSVNLEEFVERAKKFYANLPTPRKKKDIAYAVDCALHDQITYQQRHGKA